MRWPQPLHPAELNRQLDALAQGGTPCVRISPGLQTPGFGGVSIDDHAAAQAMTQDLQ